MVKEWYIFLAIYTCFYTKWLTSITAPLTCFFTVILLLLSGSCTLTKTFFSAAITRANTHNFTCFFVIHTAYPFLYLILLFSAYKKIIQIVNNQYFNMRYFFTKSTIIRRKATIHNIRTIRQDIIACKESRACNCAPAKVYISVPGIIPTTVVHR